MWRWWPVVWRWDGASFINYRVADGLAMDRVHAIHHDQDGVMWFGTFGGGVSQLATDRFTKFSEADGLPNSHVLNQAAVLTRSGDGWALAPTSIRFAGGNATVSGRSGSAPEVHAQLGAMPLDVLDLFWPNLNLSGSATGRLDYAWKSNRSGRLDLKVHGLSRDFNAGTLWVNDRLTSRKI